MHYIYGSKSETIRTNIQILLVIKQLSELSFPEFHLERANRLTSVTVKNIPPPLQLIILHTYDMPNYTPLVCRNFKFDTCKIHKSNFTNEGNYLCI